MSLKDLLLDVNEEAKSIIAPQFRMDVGAALTLPSIADPDITFENFDEQSKRIKVVETCVLHIDLRQSTKLNMEHDPVTLSKLYSCFVRGVIRCGEFYGGKVRNIAGDRVMLLFDPKGCFEGAVNTAMLLHTFVRFILGRHFKEAIVRCGIGIDFGKMLATKVGAIKRGTETAGEEARSLVWLGSPANVASKLADIAGKSFSKPKVSVSYYYPVTNQHHRSEKEIDEFFDSLEMTYSYPMIARFKEPYVFSFFKTVGFYGYSPILMSKKVFDGFKAACPNEQSVREGWWRPRSVSVAGYAGLIYEGEVFFTFGKELEVRDKLRTVLRQQAIPN